VVREEDNNQLNSCLFTATFAVAGGRKCFIGPANLGGNHCGNDSLKISVRETFGNLIE
jgi:hypothetical protein